MLSLYDHFFAAAVEDYMRFAEILLRVLLPNYWFEKRLGNIAEM
jgi:hypothetical protein